MTVFYLRHNCQRCQWGTGDFCVCHQTLRLIICADNVIGQVFITLVNLILTCSAKTGQVFITLVNVILRCSSNNGLVLRCSAKPKVFHHVCTPKSAHNYFLFMGI